MRLLIGAEPTASLFGGSGAPRMMARRRIWSRFKIVPKAIPSRSTSNPTLSPVPEICKLPFNDSIRRRVAMGMIDDILKAFDRIPGMKEIQGLPERVKALEQRVSDLQATL